VISKQRIYAVQDLECRIIEIVDWVFNRADTTNAPAYPVVPTNGFFQVE
jgi:hypothetical protein